MSDPVDKILKANTGRFRAYPEYKDSGIEWLGEIPAHWKAKRLKYLTSINDEALGEDTETDKEILYIDISNVDRTAGIINKEQLVFSQAPSRARRIVKDGDVIVSTVRTYLRAITPIIDPEPNLIVSTGFAVIRPHQLLSSFAAYALQATYFVERVVANSVGVSYPAINASEIGGFPIAYPDLQDQKEIAAFLDRETAKIDALVKKKEQLIELLKEKRTALITRAVTKGLDPSVPMKDSGIEWLGEIPAHWHIEENNWLFKEEDGRSQLGDEELLTVSHITGVTRRSEKPDVTMIEAESHEGYKICKANQLAINTMWAWMGALGIALEDGIVSPSYNVYSIVSPNLAPRYYDYLCRVPLHVTEIIRYSKGIWRSRLRLYPEAFFEMRTTLPPRSEQNKIVAFLDRKTAKIDMLVDKIKEAIGRLKEYRTALISAAVTGKIDVREEVA